MLFVFDNLSNVEKILKGQPWSFHKHLIVMQRYTGDTPVQELEFKKIPFWVQVHDIPTSFQTTKAAKSLCDTVGDIQISNGAVDEDGVSFFQVRVTIDITLPLCRGKVITLPSGEKRWVKFKYKHLPSLCYWCECLTHDDRDCDLWIQSNGMLVLDKQWFGLSLRAPPYTSAGNDVIYVLAYYKSKGGKVKAQIRGDDGSPNVVHHNLGNSSSMEIEPMREEEGRNDKRIEEAITKLNAQQILGGEIDSIEIMRESCSMPTHQEAIKVNGKSFNLGSCPQIAEFDTEFNR